MQDEVAERSQIVGTDGDLAQDQRTGFGNVANFDIRHGMEDLANLGFDVSASGAGSIPARLRSITVGAGS